MVVHPTSGFEPGINVSGDGQTVYVDVPNGLVAGVRQPTNTSESASYLLKSTDGGRSFAPLPPGLRGNYLGGGDSDVTVDPATGVLSMTDLWLGSSTVSVSKDGGVSWVSNPLQATPTQDRQWVAAAKDGRVYHATHQIPAGIVVSVSADSGLTYPVQYVAATLSDQTGCVCPTGPLVVSPGDLLTDRVATAYYTSTGGIKVAHSENSGVTFENTVVTKSEANVEDAFPVLASPGGRKLFLVWQEVRGTGASVMFSASGDWGSTWTRPTALVRDATSAYPWITARGNKVAIAFLHTRDRAEPGKVGAGARWHLTYLESRNEGRTWTKPVVADPTPVKTGPICQAGLSCSSNRELGEFVNIALDARGTAHIAYVRAAGGKTQTRYVRQR